MSEVLALALSYPSVIYTVLLGVMIVYWLFVMVGAIDLGEERRRRARGRREGRARGQHGGRARGQREGRARGQREGRARR